MKPQQIRELQRRAAQRRRQQAIALDFLPLTALTDGTATPERTTFLEPKEFVALLEDLTLAMFDGTYQHDREQVRYGDYCGYLDRTRLIEGLGEVARLQLGARRHYLVLPRPADVIEALEQYRLTLFAELRARFPTSDAFTAYFIERAPREWRPLRRDQVAAEQPALIALANMVLKFCRHHYNVRPLPFDGWHLGREQETRSISLRFPPEEHWSAYLRTWAERLHVAHTDFGGFALPGGGGNGTAKKKKKRKATNSERRYLPERLLFYMSLPGYVETRALQGKNKNDYQVISFGPRCIVDSPWLNNRLFGLEAPLDVCLRIAIRLKGEIQNNPLCTLDPKHDERGRWKDAVRTWLGC